MSRRLFTSTRERRLWTSAGAVITAIVLSLVFGSALAGIVADGMTTLAFVIGALAVLVAVVAQGLGGKKPTFVTVGVLVGGGATYLLLFVRISIPTERSHPVEYGVLGGLILTGLLQRRDNGAGPRRPGLVALLLAVGVGVAEELIKAVIPSQTCRWLASSFGSQKGRCPMSWACDSSGLAVSQAPCPNCSSCGGEGSKPVSSTQVLDRQAASRTRLRLPELLAILCVCLAACGGSDAEPGPATPPQEAAVVTADDYTYLPAVLTLGDKQVVEVRNSGGLAHTWTVIDQPVTAEDQIAGSAVLVEVEVGVGQIGTADVSGLAPGTYQVVCAIPGHFSAGMVGELVIDGN